MKELIDIQNKLRAPKSLHNKFGNYNYRNTEGILEALKPLLVEHNCTLILTDEIVECGERVYVMATARISNAAGESIAVNAYAREAFEKKGMDESQITGASSSYARKFALNGLFLIDDVKDADFYNTGEERKPRAKSSAAAENTSGTDNADPVFAAVLKITNATNIEEIKALWSKYKHLDTPDANGVKQISRVISVRRQELGI